MVEPTVSEAIQIDGTPDMTYAFLDTTAKLEKLSLTPLGLTVVSDISEMDPEQLGFADLSTDIRFKQIDGRELVVSSHDAEAYTITGSSSYYFEQPDGKILLTSTYQFQAPISLAEVSGMYMEDYYLSFGE